MNVGQLTATFDLDSAPAARGITEAELAMLGLQRTSDGRLRDMRGRFASESQAMGETLARGLEQGTEEGSRRVDSSLLVLRRNADGRLRDINGTLEARAREAGEALENGIGGGAEDASQRTLRSMTDAALSVNGFTRDASGRIRDMRGRFISDSTTLGDALARNVGEGGERAAERLGQGMARASRDIVNAGDDGNRFTRVLNQIGGAVSGPLSGVGGFFVSLPGLILASVPALAGLSSALVAIAPAAGIAATGVLALVSAAAAIKIGTSGIGAALKAAFAPPSGGGGGGSAVNTAQQIANAQLALKDTIQQTADANILAARNVGDAQRTLADDVQAAANTQVQAERQVESAERNLADAQKAAHQAQLDLNAARVQAKMDMEDLANQVTDAALGQRGDVLAVQQAKAALDATLSNPGANEAAREQAQLTYDQAVQHLQEQGLTLDRLRDKQAAATKAGVEGSALVVSAQDKVAAAQRTVGDQTQALADAQVQAQAQVTAALRKVGDQVRNVQDAQAQQAKTAYQGAEQVAKAQQALQQSGASAAGGGVDPLAAAMAKLAPSARAFVREIMALGPAWTALKLDVQQRLFAGMASTLGTTASTLLPVLRTRLGETADAVNLMGRGVLTTAGHLAESGAFGRALGAANTGLRNLSNLPSTIVQGIVQIGAAAGPAFDRMTATGGTALDKLAARMSKGLASGGMEKAISTGLDLLDQLGRVLGNVGDIIGSVFGAAQQTGGSWLSTMEKVTAQVAKAFNSPEVQAGLQALFKTISVFASTAAPLLGQALGVIGPVLAALGPPLQLLITSLGSALSPIIAALGPVLLAAAQAVGQLLVAVSPLLPVAGSLIALLGPILTPILNAVSLIFQQLAPIVQQVGDILGATLSPILAQLPGLLKPFLDLVTNLTGQLLPVLSQLLAAVSPSLTQLGQIFGQLMVALAPVLTQIGQLISARIGMLMPLLPPLITFIGQLAQMLASALAGNIQRIVIPALQMFTDLLSGNASGALHDFKQLAIGVVKELVDQFILLPMHIMDALGNLSSTLYDAGTKIIGGLLDGIRSKIGDVKNVLGDLTDKIASWKGPPSRDKVLLAPAGALIMDGLMAGISGRVPALRGQLQGLTQEIGGMAMGGLGGPQMAMAGSSGGTGLHIEHYHESDSGSAYSTATELNWLSKGRG